MCVIALCNSERLTDEQVTKMFSANPKGGGVAWREGNAVRWKKGLDVDEMAEMCATLPLPLVAHFRIPSCGGPSPLLTHPFPITKDVQLALEGSIKGSVLFHNGHWHQWKSDMKEAAIRGGNKIPMGRWSDSRAMAWMAANFGTGMLEFIDEKAIVFGPGDKDIEIFNVSGWSKMGTGIWVSNMSWQGERINYDAAPFYGNRPGNTAPKKDDKAPSSDDKEEPQEGDGRKTAPAGSGERATQQSQTTLTPSSTSRGSKTHKKSGGSTISPLDSYLATTRLWVSGAISSKALKRERRKYETWCLQNKVNMLPRPVRPTPPLVH